MMGLFLIVLLCIIGALMTGNVGWIVGAIVLTVLVFTLASDF